MHWIFTLLGALLFLPMKSIALFQISSVAGRFMGKTCWKGWSMTDLRIEG